MWLSLNSVILNCILELSTIMVVIWHSSGFGINEGLVEIVVIVHVTRVSFLVFAEVPDTTSSESEAADNTNDDSDQSTGGSLSGFQHCNIAFSIKFSVVISSIIFPLSVTFTTCFVSISFLGISGGFVCGVAFFKCRFSTSNIFACRGNSVISTSLAYFSTCRCSIADFSSTNLTCIPWTSFWASGI